MAYNAYGNWIVCRNVAKMTSNDSEKAATYQGEVFRVVSSVTQFAQGDTVYFHDSEKVFSTDHSGNDYYFVPLENIVLLNN